MPNELGGSEQSGQGSSADNVPRLSDDRLYRALTSARRRRVLYLLLEEGERTLEEIATVLTGWDATETDTIGTADDREQILATLQHVHLPRLSEADLVDYDRQSGTIDIEPLDPVVEDLIRRSVESETPSSS